jgi:hypothetical protein
MLCALGCDHVTRSAAAPPDVTRVGAAHVVPRAMCDEIVMDDPRDLMFEACAKYVPKFEAAVAVACRASVPLLADAAVGRKGSRCNGPDDTYGVSPSFERERARASAGRELIPGLKERWPVGIPCDDLGRQVWELDHGWRRTQPDDEVAAIYTEESGIDVHYRMGRLTIGTQLFARSLAPHLTATSRAHLRKFLVCEVTERETELAK